MQGKTTKPSYLNTIPCSQCLGHLLEHGLNGKLHIFRGKLALMGDDTFDQLRLGHGFPFYIKRLDQHRMVLARNQRFEQPCRDIQK